MKICHNERGNVSLAVQQAIYLIQYTSNESVVRARM